MKQLVPKAQFGGFLKLLRSASRSIRSRSVAKALDKTIQNGVRPQLYDKGTIYRTTTPKEVSSLSDGTFVIHPNAGNHEAYGWRVGAPFYKPGSHIERKMLSKRNGFDVADPVYLTTPVDDNLMVRVGSGGRYGEPVKATLVHPGGPNDYQITGSLYFPEESSIAFFSGDKLPTKITAWQKVNGQWQFEDIELPKRIILE